MAGVLHPFMGCFSLFGGPLALGRAVSARFSLCKGVAACTGEFYPTEGWHSPWQGCFSPCQGVAPHLMPSLVSTGDSSPRGDMEQLQ